MLWRALVAVAWFGHLVKGDAADSVGDDCGGDRLLLLVAVYVKVAVVKKYSEAVDGRPHGDDGGVDMRDFDGRSLFFDDVVDEVGKGCVGGHLRVTNSAWVSDRGLGDVKNVSESELLGRDDAVEKVLVRGGKVHIGFAAGHKLVAGGFRGVAHQGVVECCL